MNFKFYFDSILYEQIFPILPCSLILHVTLSLDEIIFAKKDNYDLATKKDSQLSENLLLKQYFSNFNNATFEFDSR